MRFLGSLIIQICMATGSRSTSRKISVTCGRLISDRFIPNLKDLEEEGFINMLQVAPSEDGGPHKKMYSITEKGVVEFSRWLAESPQRHMLIRDSFLLKFAFFGFGDDERALEIIDEQIEIFKAQLKRRQINRKRWKRQGVYVSLIAELGITQNEMYLEWLHHARAEIEKSSKGAVTGKNIAIL